jgi:hypothetical protein
MAAPERRGRISYNWGHDSLFGPCKAHRWLPKLCLGAIGNKPALFLGASAGAVSAACSCSHPRTARPSIATTADRAMA